MLVPQLTGVSSGTSAKMLASYSVPDSRGNVAQP